MSTDIHDCVPALQEKYNQGVAILNSMGKKTVVTFTLRSDTMQNALWSKGHEDFDTCNSKLASQGLPLLECTKEYYQNHMSEFVVTHCDGYKIKSSHQGGHAFDINPIGKNGDPTWDYATYADEFKAIRDVFNSIGGVQCGSDWMTQPNGSPSPYSKWGLGWDPPHIELKVG